MKAQKMFVMFAAIGMMLATSCSNYEKFELTDNKAQVTFSLGLENGMDTRAISDGSGVNKLIYALFDSEGNRVAESDASAQFPFEKTVSLIKGEQYTAVFWAQNWDCDAYTISDDYKTIHVNYDNALNNDERRDAFFKAETFTVTEGANINVVLKRPFAQVNLGVTEQEWQNAKSAGFEIARSSVEIKQAATTLNLIDGSVGGAKDVTFASNAILADEKLTVDVDCDGNSEDFKYLSMCYFLANDVVNGASSTILDGLKFVLYSADESKSFELSDGLANAPVQRNHRTNIVGYGVNGENVITDRICVKVTLDPLYDGEHTLNSDNVWEGNLGIYTEEALAGMTIEMPAGWHIRNGFIIEPMPENWTSSAPNSMDQTWAIYEKPYTIDGKGNVVTFEPYNYKFVAKNAFAATNGALVTIKNLVFAGEHFGVFGGVYGGSDFNTVFENVTIQNNGVYCYNKDGSIPMSAFSNLGTATLNNCTVTGTYWVGKKDENLNAQASYDRFGIYDVFVPNNKKTIINNSTIGSINVNNHGNLVISGTSMVDVIDALDLVKGTVTIQKDAKVTLLNADEYSASYAPTVNIEAGATVETLQLNSMTKLSKITLDEGANISKIIYKGVEYTSIADFKAAQ